MRSRRGPLAINTHGDSDEYHCLQGWGGTCAHLTSGVASNGRMRRGRSFIGIVAPGCKSLCHTLSGGSGGVSGSGLVRARCPELVRFGRGAGEVQARCSKESKKERNGSCAAGSHFGSARTIGGVTSAKARLRVVRLDPLGQGRGAGSLSIALPGPKRGRFRPPGHGPALLRRCWAVRHQAAVDRYSRPPLAAYCAWSALALTGYTLSSGTITCSVPRT